MRVEIAKRDGGGIGGCALGYEGWDKVAIRRLGSWEVGRRTTQGLNGFERNMSER